jgi:DNA polymerase-3 subunit chi
MAQVEFHTNVADPQDYAVRLVRKASRQGARLVVVCEDPVAFSQALWQASAVDFVAHASTEAEPATVAASAVLLSSSAAVIGRSTDKDVLVNTSPNWPAEHAAYARVIEIVAQSPESVSAGRIRWKQYLNDGVVPDKLG